MVTAAGVGITVKRIGPQKAKVAIARKKAVIVIASGATAPSSIGEWERQLETSFNSSGRAATPAASGRDGGAGDLGRSTAGELRTSLDTVRRPPRTPT